MDAHKLLDKKKYEKHYTKFSAAIAFLINVQRTYYFKPGKVENLFCIIDVKDVGITDIPKEVSYLVFLCFNF